MESSRPEIEPLSAALGGQFLSMGPSGKSWGLLFFSSPSSWGPGGGGHFFLSSMRSPTQDMWLWMLVECMFKSCHIEPNFFKVWQDIKTSFSWKSEVVMKCVVLDLEQNPRCALWVSPWHDWWFTLIYVHSLKRSHSHRALEFMHWVSMVLKNAISYCLF